jgi:hypothetical protein
MSLREEILAGNFNLVHRDDGAIAAALSVGRTRAKITAIGDGTIIETLGIAAGNAFLDVIETVPDYRYVKRIIARGELDMSSLTAQGGVQAMVPAVLTQEQADKLKALGREADPISAQQVAQALEGL